jgi:hypothetical protein
VGRILEGKPHRAIATDRRGRDGLTQLLHALAQLGAAGVPLRLGALWDAYAAPAPAPAWDERMRMPVQGSNHGKRYPPPPGARVEPPYSSVHAAAAPAAVEPSSPAPPLQHAWIEAIERVQSRAVEAHTAFQQALVDSHQTFLRSTAASLFGLAALAGEAPVTRGETAPAPVVAAPLLAGSRES